MKFLKHPLTLTSLCLAGLLSFQVIADLATSQPSPSPSSHPTERILFTSETAVESILEFDAKILIHARRYLTIEKDKDLILETIDQQLQHLFGPMSFSETPAVPKGNYQAKLLTAQKADHKITEVTYHYKGNLLVSKKAGRTYSVVLPYDPQTIYQASIVKSGNRSTFPCTDEHYNTEGDFWYFWNPYQSGCTLKENIDYQVIQASLKKIDNTPQSYPEYERLVDANKKIKIAILMGMNDPTSSWNPLVSNDINAQNYRTIRETLLDSHYQSQELSAIEISKIAPGLSRSNIPHVELLTKSTPRGQIEITLFFGASGIDEDSKAFHYYFKQALEKQAVMIYDGHSGLGGHLDLPSIEETENFRFKPNKKQYQIYFFNSCSSYTYYNSVFFKRKKTLADKAGTKNLDIMTNGLATYFDVMESTNLVLVNAIEHWAVTGKKISYQKIAQDIDSHNLFGINGDEDNTP
jgi:hypothetical protein